MSRVVVELSPRFHPDSGLAGQYRRAAEAIDAQVLAAPAMLSSR